MSIRRQASKSSDVQATSTGLCTVFNDDDSFFNLRFVVGENSASFKPSSAHLSAIIMPGPACTEKRAILLPPAAR
ncbi:MAG: hypothetical protein E3J92_02105 [Dehalococcoidia bacterium]|nr:MAG: hypothetical protein E3J92_02105 [Dehalococcoidia bacterium]